MCVAGPDPGNGMKLNHILLVILAAALAFGLAVLCN